MYLSIPEGMIFQQKEVTIEGTKVLNDFFVDPAGKRPEINIQEVIQQALRCNTGRKINIENKYAFNIYLRFPPAKSNLYLNYTPNNNGKYATKDLSTVIEVMGIRAQPLTSKVCWFQEIPVRAARLAEVEEERTEQRYNRRHYGDSPSPT